VGTLTADLSNLAVEEFKKCQNKVTREFYYKVDLTCKFIIKGTSMRCELWWNDQLKQQLVLEDIDKVKDEEA
jgi:hypothetical protein